MRSPRRSRERSPRRDRSRSRERHRRSRSRDRSRERRRPTDRRRSRSNSRRRRSPSSSRSRSRDRNARKSGRAASPPPPQSDTQGSSLFTTPSPAEVAAAAAAAAAKRLSACAQTPGPSAPPLQSVLQPLSAPQLPALLPVVVAPPAADGGGHGGGGRRGPDEERPRNSWECAVGGLGGLAQKFDPTQSVSVAVASRDAAWDAAGFELEDRQMAMGRVEQAFDSTGVEQASMDQHLPPTNRGYMLLKKMGWREQTGLGRQGEGRVDPVRVSEQYAQLGLGKASEYEEKAEEATETRKAMTAELIAWEDEAGRQQREAQVARDEEIREKLREETEVFYCEVCDKRYVKVTEFENHLSSYDHHHRKRFKEMREAEKARTKASKAAAPPKKARKDPALLAAEAAAAAAAASAAAPPPPQQPPAPPAPVLDAGVDGAAGGGASADDKERRRRKLEAWKAQQTQPAAAAAPPNEAATSASGCVGADSAQGAAPPPKANKIFGGMSLGGKAGLKLGGQKAKPLSKPSGFSVDDDGE